METLYDLVNENKFLDYKTSWIYSPSLIRGYNDRKSGK